MFYFLFQLLLGRIAKAIQENVSNANRLNRFLFNFYYEYKVTWVQFGFSTPLVNRFVFGKVRNILGGRVGLIIAGGAPLTAKNQELIKTCLCTKVNQGYGLTETSGSATMSSGRIL